LQRDEVSNEIYSCVSLMDVHVLQAHLERFTALLRPFMS